MPQSSLYDLSDETIVKAALNAADILSGMGYTGKHGSIHLLQLNLQTNTITAILHNIIAWQINQLDNKWIFKPKGVPLLICSIIVEKESRLKPPPINT